ncbi:MAG: glycosyltransferase family 4 protein [Candidatus Saccharibacteria bacterium]|nr:glycosyltransferase family 4 protein [Candidatus Saccharibacteria bacterium]
MRINMVSESEISVRGHGVHTAYLELTNALNARDDCEVIVNKFLQPLKVDITHIHTIGLPSLTKLLFGSGKKVVSAHVVPASLLGSIAGAHIWLPIAKSYMKFFYRRADKVLAVSNMVAQILEKDLGIKKSKIAVTYNTIDISNYTTTIADKKSARDKLKIDAEDFVVVGNGQIQPRKRFDSFVEMAKKLTGIQFIWIGGIPFKNIGADYKKMQDLIDNVPDNLKVTGVIELEDVKAYLQAADVFVLPAEQENHPMAVIEAAAAGLPIVLRDIPEYDDTFAQDFLRCSDDRAFVDAIVKLRGNNTTYEKYQKGANAIATRFDSKAGAQQAVKIYEELLS